MNYFLCSWTEIIIIYDVVLYYQLYFTSVESPLKYQDLKSGTVTFEPLWTSNFMEENKIMNGFRGKCTEKNLRTNAPEFIGPFRQSGGPKKEIKNKTWHESDVILNFWVIYFLAETVSGNRDAVLTHRLRGRITRVIQFIPLTVC